MSVTISDIAKYSNVSISTISKVLNGRPGVSDAVRVKVLQTAEKLGYFPYIKARETGLFRSKAKYIAEVFGYLNPFLTQKIKQGISSVLNQTGFYGVDYTISDNKKEDSKIKLFFEHAIRDKDIAGIIVSFLDVNDKLINDFLQANIPVVLINSYSELTTSLIIDEKNSAYKLTEYLIQEGHRKIGLIIPDTDGAAVWRQRLEGYKSALQDNNIQYDLNLVEFENSFIIDNIKIATMSLLNRNKDIDAIIFASDWQAYAGINYLKSNNISVPDSISVVGFDNLEFSELIMPALTTIKHPLNKIGEDAAKYLMEAIKKKSKPEKIVYDTKLIIRNSTKPR